MILISTEILQKILNLGSKVQASQGQLSRRVPPCPSIPWFLGFPWFILSKEFPCLFWYFLCFFQGFCGFGSERKSLVPEKLDFGPFRLRFGSIWLRFGFVSAPFRGVGWGRGEGAFVREKNITTQWVEGVLTLWLLSTTEAHTPKMVGIWVCCSKSGRTSSSSSDAPCREGLLANTHTHTPTGRKSVSDNPFPLNEGVVVVNRNCLIGLPQMGV